MSALFELNSPYAPMGDQVKAITDLSEGVERGLRSQTLLGVTGSGKTFTMANIIARAGRPTLILAPNKTLAAQLYGEMMRLFPKNAVEYFVSYYDYFQPEAYIPVSDTYIEKSCDRNDLLDRLRLSATRSLLTRRDVIVVASVSCIYGLSKPETYLEMRSSIAVGDVIDQHAFLKSLVAPYKHLGIRIMPTGGVTSANAADYLSIPEVAAVGGTWLGKTADMRAGNWDAIAKSVEEAVALVRSLAQA